MRYKHDRIFVRSNVQTIEQGYYRTVVRYQEAAMGMTSAAEAKLDARIRPEITILRSRTSYPRRTRRPVSHRPALSVLPGGAEAGQVVRPTREETEAAGAAAAPATLAEAGVGAGPRPVPGQAAARQARVGEAASGPARRAAANGHVRLTRRGKIVVGALAGVAAAGLAVLIWLAIAGQAEAAGPGGLQGGSGAGQTMLRVVVHPGETLWSIAVRTDPTADPRAVIQQIIDDNALRGPAIQAGQVLWVPRI
jgi:LysM domain-containing protein